MEKEYKKGLVRSKLVSHKQAILRAILQGIAFGIALFIPVSIILKVIIFIFLLFIIGVVASSKRFTGKI